MNDRIKSRELMQTIIQFGSDTNALDLWLSTYAPSQHSNRENVSVIRSTYRFKVYLQQWDELLEQIKNLLIERSEDPERWLVGLYKEE